ncbi:MAG TPA: EF-hand domain-containing protein [Herbaspirillum sp.]
MSGGQSSNVTPLSTASLSSKSLSEAWAPQMHVQADADHDNLLSASEFEDQMQRVGIAVAQAQEMFRTFDKSGDGRISVEEYVAGVKASNSSGSTLFNRLLDSYVRNPDGKINDQAETDFLSKGSAAAEKYWAGKR